MNKTLLNRFLLLIAFLPIKLYGFESYFWQQADGKVAALLLIPENELSTLSHQGKCSTEVSIQIEFRKKNGQIIESSIFQKKYPLVPENHYQLHIQKWYNLPVGEYEAWFSWSQGWEPMKTYTQLIHVKSIKTDFFLSDLLLYTENTLLSPTSSVQRKEMKIFTSFHTHQKKNVRLQATLLYQMRDNPGRLTRAYITQQQKNKIIDASPGVHSQTFYFNLEGLSSGNYLVDFSVFEDNKLIAEKTKSFSLSWAGLDSVLSHIDSSIVQMKYVSTPTQIHELLQITDPVLKIIEFKKFWKKQNLSPADHETQAMEDYYKLIYEANRKYTHGWQSAQGKQWVLYQE